MRNLLRSVKKKVISLFIKNIRYICLLLYRCGLEFKQAHLAYEFIKLDENIKKIPGFTVLNERKYMHHFARSLYQNKGFICELGCTFGSFTASLASALDKGSKKIFCYDLFIYHDSFCDVLKSTEFKDLLKSGESFYHIFEHYTSAYKLFIQATPGDLNKLSWNKGMIEFLVIDAMKSDTLADSILKKFYRHLDVGSIIFHQDFCHFHEPWIHLIHYKLNEHFKFICHIEDSSSVVFKMTKKIDSSKISAGFNLMDFTSNDIVKAFDYSLSRIDEEPAKQNVIAAKIYCLLACHFFDEANTTLNETLASYDFVEIGNLEYVVKIAEKVASEKDTIVKEFVSNGKNLLTELDYITEITNS